LQLIPASDDPHAIVARLGNADQIAAYAGLARKP
jgi:hypothetical protein